MLTEELKNFTGSETFYKIFGDTVITEGVKYFADKAEAYWLIQDIVINCKMRNELKNEGFISIKAYKPLDLMKDGILVAYEDGNYLELYSQYYPNSKLPKGVYSFWFTDNTLLLPSEY